MGLLTRVVGLIVDIGSIANALGHPKYTSATWYFFNGIQSSIAATAPPTSNTGIMKLIPVYIRDTVTIAKIGVQIITAATTNGSTVTIGLYVNDTTYNRPTGASLFTASSIATTTAGSTYKALDGGNTKINQGWYWLAVQQSDNVAAFSGVSSTDLTLISYFGSSTQDDLQKGTAYTSATHLYVSNASYPTLPTLSPTGNSYPSLTTNPPKISFQTA